MESLIALSTTLSSGISIPSISPVLEQLFKKKPMTIIKKT
jgi:hypothetical protein